MNHLTKNVRILSIAFICLFVGVVSSLAQEVRVLPTLERNEILIGEQVKMQVRVIHEKATPARLILPPDTLVSGVEIIDYGLVDSLEVNDKLREAVYSVVITSFDSAMYVLDNIQALVGDSLHKASETPTLLVNTVPVDLSNPEQYNDIKGAWKTPFVWKDYLIYVISGLLVLILAFGGYRLWLYIKRPKEASEVKSAEPEKEPYEEAMEALSALKSRGLWENNQTKQYYTELTDILRRYIFRVYGIATWDRTSTEILEAFRLGVTKDHSYTALQRILSTADLAKFAKYIPSAQDNIGIFNLSETFVNENRPQQTDEITSEPTTSGE